MVFMVWETMHQTWTRKVWVETVLFPNQTILFVMQIIWSPIGIMRSLPGVAPVAA